MSQVEKVAQQYAAIVWPHIEQFVRDVEPHSAGDWTTDQLKSDVLQGRMSMIVAMEDKKFIGVLLYYMQNRRNSRVAFIAASGGEKIFNDDVFNVVKQIMRDEGAQSAEAAMRPSVLRLCGRIGFEERYRIAGVQL